MRRLPRREGACFAHARHPHDAEVEWHRVLPRGEAGVEHVERDATFEVLVIDGAREPR